MADAKPVTPRQRRIAGWLFAAVGLVNLVLGVVAGAVLTLAIAVVMLVVGGALLLSPGSRDVRPPER